VRAHAACSLTAPASGDNLPRVETTGFGPATPLVQGSAVVGEQQGRYLRERQEAYLRGVGDVAKSRNRTPFSGMIVPALYAKENGMLLAYLDDSGELGIVLFATVIVPEQALESTHVVYEGALEGA